MTYTIEKVGPDETPFCIMADGVRGKCFATMEEATGEAEKVKVRAASVRHLHLRGATGQIRTEMFEGREHIVVPVVAMVEGVVWAVNSDVPEFVPAEELAETPQQWNGRRAFAGHPADGGTQVTANTPNTLEQSFGTIFNTASAEEILTKRKLFFEVWLDPERAAAVGPAALSVIERLLAGEVVEVSVGCYVEPDATDGTWQGKEYHGIWRNIVSDHIAFLGPGEEGACSVAAGCGSPRAAVKHLVTAMGIIRADHETFNIESIEVTKMASDNKKRGLKDRFLSLLNSVRANAAEPGVSDADLRGKLTDALFASEPGFMGISEVYPADNMVIYEVCPEEEWKTMRRPYTTAEDGSVTLGDAEQVEVVVSYEPIMKAAATPPKAPCGCRTAENKETDMEKEARIAALVANAHNKLSAEGLKALSENDLKAHEESVKALAESQAKIDDANAKLAAATAAPKTLTREQIFAADPGIKAAVEAHEAVEAAEKKELVEKLAAASSALTAEQLTAKPIEDLRTLAAFAKVEVAPVDNSGRAVPRVLATTKTEDFAPPSPYEKDLKAARAQTTH